MTLLGSKSEGLFFVVSAPAGTGKTTLVHMLLQEFPSVAESISYTTRQPRADEVDGVHYHFVSEELFKAMIDSSDFLEYVELYGYHYGTSLKWLQEQKRQGKHIILVIDTQGARLIRGKIAATFIFIKPPSLEVLRQRLLLRGTETSEGLEKRLARASAELSEAHYYDYQIINDDLQNAYQVLRSIVIAECHRTSYLK